MKSWFHIAHDAVKGIISANGAVAETASAPRTVAPNSPNSVNPSATIIGTVTIDINTTVGRKMETLINTVLCAGLHRVT